MGGEVLEGELFWGPLLREKTRIKQKKQPRNSSPKFGRPKFVSHDSALNSGSGGAESLVQKFVPEILGNFQAAFSGWRNPCFWQTLVLLEGTRAIFVIFVGFRALRSATPCFCGRM